MMTKAPGLVRAGRFGFISRRGGTKKMTLDTEPISPWLQMLWDQGGSDLLLTGGSAPRLRVDGKAPSALKRPRKR